MNHNEVEQQLDRLGKSAPRVRPQDIDAAIVGRAFHRWPGTGVTSCLLTLYNGFTVLGYSACVSLENFDAGIGERVAEANAKSKVDDVLGALLAEQLYRAQGAQPPGQSFEELVDAVPLHQDGAGPVLTDADAAADLSGEPQPDNPGAEANPVSQTTGD